MSVFLAVAALLALFVAGTASAQGKIGFVNLDRILRDAAPALRAQKKIEAEFSKKEQEIANLGEKLKKLQETYGKNAPTMSENDRRNKEREIKDADREFQRKRVAFGEDLNQRRNEELASVLDRANRAVKQIAESEKYDIVFQEAVWADPRVDITEKVIKALDDSRPATK